jgi:threonine/homoserine efflux transporter RhtA
VIHSPTTLFAPRDVRAERRLWSLLSALFILVAAVNGIIALTEAAWWQGALATMALIAAAACARTARK